MKLLITGASGLLGSDMRHSAELRKIACVKVAARPHEGFLQADIATPEGLAKIAAQDWDAIIHTAAWRSPEACDQDPKGAFALNAFATGNLAALAAKRHAKFLYISTDYVFPGVKPPYSETDAPNPINTYGKAKLAGEQEAFKAKPNAAVLRIPFLFGWRAGVERCSLIVSALDAIKTGKGVDDSIVRYPTCTQDVAEAAMLILERGSTGIHHFSFSDKLTRYKIAVCIAKLIGQDPAKVNRLSTPPSKDSDRPVDAHLSMQKLLDLGCPPPPPFEQRMAICLKELGLIP